MSKLEVLDTLLVKNGRISLKEHHIDRTAEAFEFLSWPISRDSLQKTYDALENQADACLRLVFSPALEVTVKNLDPLPDLIRLTPQVLAGPEFSVPHCLYKWTLRDHWHLSLDTDDVLALTADGRLKETSRFNIFALNCTLGVFFTPPLKTGCLNGVFRRAAIKSGFIPWQGINYPLREEDIHLRDLAEYQLFVGNSVRGLLPAIVI